MEIVESNRAGRLFATIFTLMAFTGGLFAINQATIVELAGAFAYAGGAVGVAPAGDLITVFVFLGDDGHRLDGDHLGCRHPAGL